VRSLTISVRRLWRTGSRNISRDQKKKRKNLNALSSIYFMTVFYMPLCRRFTPRKEKKAGKKREKGGKGGEGFRPASPAFPRLSCRARLHFLMLRRAANEKRFFEVRERKRGEDRGAPSLQSHRSTAAIHNPESPRWTKERGDQRRKEGEGKKFEPSPQHNN